jgi:hypothetical protein
VKKNKGVKTNANGKEEWLLSGSGQTFEGKRSKTGQL